MENASRVRQIPQWISGHRKLSCIILSGVAAVTAGTTITAALFGQNVQAANSEAVYREYQAAVGDLTVGSSESGTISLERQTITFPVDATIDSILVKAGTEVKEGDSLIQLDPDSVSDGSSTSNAKLEQAKLALDKAITEQKVKLEAAKEAYNSSTALSGYSTTQLKLTQQEIQNGIDTAKQNLDTAEKQLKKYQELLTTYDSDTARLEELESWMEEAENMKTTYKQQVSNYETKYKTVLERLSSLKSEMQKAGSGESYDEAKAAYDDYYDEVEDIVDNQSALATKVARYTAEYENYKSAYDDFKEEYDENYDVQDKEELSDKIASLELSYQDAQIKYEKEQNEAKISLLNAQQELQSSRTEISTAQSTYDNSVKELELSVVTQQAEYNTLKRQLEDLESAMNGGGLITAPCDGIVSSVSYSDGDDITANQVLLTILKPSALSMSLSLSEEDVTAVKVGQQAEITLTAYDGQTLSAEVDSITTEPARSGSASVSYTVTVKMTGENSNTVYEGMSGEATLVQKKIEDVLYVSNQAIIFEDGKSYVLLKSASGDSVKTQVKTGFTNGRYVEILDGINEGDTVLAESAVSAK